MIIKNGNNNSMSSVNKLKENNTTVTCKQGISDLFNNYFVKVGDNLAKKIQPLPLSVVDEKKVIKQ